MYLNPVLAVSSSWGIAYDAQHVVVSSRILGLSIQSINSCFSAVSKFTARARELGQVSPSRVSDGEDRWSALSLSHLALELGITAPPPHLPVLAGIGQLSLRFRSAYVAHSSPVSRARSTAFVVPAWGSGVELLVLDTFPRVQPFVPVLV